MRHRIIRHIRYLNVSVHLGSIKATEHKIADRNRRMHEIIMNTLCIFAVVYFVPYLQICHADLKMIQAVFRHGNRAPNKIGFYPKDPYVNNTYEPEGPGSLTIAGKMSSYELGQYFHNRYGKFLGPVYSNKNVWFRADELERTVVTGQLVAAALFPPVKKQRWNPNLAWQPIPVWTMPINKDVLYGGVSCKNHRKWRAEIEQKDLYLRKRREKLKSFYELLSKNTGSYITQRQTYYLHQHLYAQMDLGLDLPKWTKPIFPKGELTDVAIFDIIIQSYTHEMKQLLSGIWIAEWLNRVEAHLNGTDSRKGFFYSGHDLHIGAILVGLNNYNHRVPSYSSSIIFELHQIHKNFYVQVMHRDSGYDRTLEIPGCSSEMCPLDTFKKIFSHLIPDDPEQMCGGLSFEI